MSMDASLGACLHPVFTAALLSNQCPSHRRLQSTTSHGHLKVVAFKHIVSCGRSGLGTTMYVVGTRQQRGVHYPLGGEPALHFNPTLRFLRGNCNSSSRLISNSFFVMARRPDDEEEANNEELGAAQSDQESSLLDSSSGEPASMGKQLGKIIRDMGGSSDPQNKLLTQFAAVLNKAYDIGAASAARAVIAMAGKSVDDVLRSKAPAAEARIEEETPTKPDIAEFENTESVLMNTTDQVQLGVELPVGSDTGAANGTVKNPAPFGPAPDPWDTPMLKSENNSQDFSMDSLADVGEDPIADPRKVENRPGLYVLREPKGRSEEEPTAEDALDDLREEDGAADLGRKEPEPVRNVDEVVDAIDEETAAPAADDEDDKEPAVAETEVQNDEEKVVPDAEGDSNDQTDFEAEGENIPEDLEAIPSANSTSKEEDPEAPGQIPSEGMPSTDKGSVLPIPDELIVAQDDDLSDLLDSEETTIDNEELLSQDSDLKVLDARSRGWEPTADLQFRETYSSVDETEHELLESETIPESSAEDPDPDENEEPVPQEKTEDQEQLSDTEEPENASEVRRKLAFGLSSIQRRAKNELPVNVKKPSNKSPSIEESLRKSSPSIGGRKGLDYVKEYAESAKGKMQRRSSENPPPDTSDFHTPPAALLNKDKSSQSTAPASEQTEKMQKIGTMWWEGSADDGGDGPNGGGGGGGGSGSGGHGNEDSLPEEGGGWWLQVFVSVLTMTAAVFSVLKAVVKPKDRRTSTM